MGVENSLTVESAFGFSVYLSAVLGEEAVMGVKELLFAGISGPERGMDAQLRPAGCTPIGRLSSILISKRGAVAKKQDVRVTLLPLTPEEISYFLIMAV